MTPDSPNGASRRKLLSIVTPCYNEEANVVDCYESLRRIVENELPGYDYEHVFCDNASTDGTLDLLRELAERDDRVKVIANARNFGPFNSLFNGIIATRGDAVLLFLPADLQDPPELLPQFVALWEQGHEVVWGVRRWREESRLMRSIRRLYYRIVAETASMTIPQGAGEFQLVDRRVIAALRQFEDYYPYIRGMVAYCGFRSTHIDYTWRARKRGITKNNLLRLIDQGLNGLISFTNVPMRLCMAFGFGISALSFLYGFFALAANLIYYRSLAPAGIPTLIVSLFFFSGLQLFFFGVIGEYVSAIHLQVRPPVVERERITFGPTADPGPAADRPAQDAGAAGAEAPRS
jgi:glycosyltransferase involved in cell wall biosynthesis